MEPISCRRPSTHPPNAVSGRAEHLAEPGAPTRSESDSLGTVEVPADAYWGVHTMRALENFPISKRPISVYPELIVALASVKQAAARANRELGVLDAAEGGVDRRGLPAHHRRRAARPVRRRRHPGRRRHLDQHERQRGHREPRARDRRLRQGPLRRAAPDRRREPQPVDERHLSDRGEARDGLLAAHDALRARPVAHRLRAQGPRVQRRPQGRSHAAAGRRADDARAGVPRLRHDARRRRRPASRDHQAAVRGQPRRHGDRHGHHGRPRVRRRRASRTSAPSPACASSRRPTSSRRRATPACS